MRDDRERLRDAELLEGAIERAVLAALEEHDRLKRERKQNTASRITDEQIASRVRAEEIRIFGEVDES